MLMAWKGNIPVQGIGVSQGEELAATQGDHFLGRRKPAVVAHDAAHKTGPEQHICPFQEQNLRTLFPRGYGRSAAGPAAANNDYLHNYTVLLTDN
jgi:hypothetical protein